MDCNEALEEEFLKFGKEYFHTNLCTCCRNFTFSTTNELEPLPDFHFVNKYERHLQNIDDIKS